MYFKKLSLLDWYFIFWSIFLTMQLSIYCLSDDGQILAPKCFGGNKWTLPADEMAYVRSSLFPKHLTVFWWEQVDSNHRPHAYQACALTSWAMFPWFCLFFAHCLRFSANLTTKSCLVEVSGIEPLTPCLQGRCSPSWAIPPKKSGLTWLRKQMPRLTEHNLLKTNRGNRRSITSCFCLD